MIYRVKESPHQYIVKCLQTKTFYEFRFCIKNADLYRRMLNTSRMTIWNIKLTKCTEDLLQENITSEKLNSAIIKRLDIVVFLKQE